MSAIALFNGNTSTSISTVSKGGTVTFMTKKAYGAKYSLKGAALRRAHEQYRIERGVAGNGALATLMTSGQVLAERVKWNKSETGFTVGFTLASKLGAAPVDAKAAAAQLSDDQLLAIIAARSASKPATQPAE